MIGAPELENFFDHLALLVDFDGIYAAVATLIAVLAHGGIESLVHFAETMFQDVGEADQNGQRYAAPLERIDELLQIDAALSFFSRMNEEVSVFANREISFTPTRNVVKLCRVGGSPTIGGFAHLGGDGNFGVQ